MKRRPTLRFVSALLALALSLGGFRVSAARCAPASDCAPCCKGKSAQQSTPSLRPLLPCCRTVAASTETGRPATTIFETHQLSPAVLTSRALPASFALTNTDAPALKRARFLVTPLYQQHCALLL